MNKPIIVLGPNPARGLALLAQTTAENGPVGPTPAARRARGYRGQCQRGGVTGGDGEAAPVG
jgi:hypothetical protein